MTLSGTVMVVVSCFAISAGALAQQVPATPTPAPSTEQPASPSAPPPQAGSQPPVAGSQPSASSRQITRDQFTQRAAEAAGRTFDMIDTNHAGVITQQQLRQWQVAHRRPARAAPSAGSQ